MRPHQHGPTRPNRTKMNEDSEAKKNLFAKIATTIPGRSKKDAKNPETWGGHRGINPEEKKMLKGILGDVKEIAGQIQDTSNRIAAEEDAGRPKLRENMKKYRANLANLLKLDFHMETDDVNKW